MMALKTITAGYFGYLAYELASTVQHVVLFIITRGQ